MTSYVENETEVLFDFDIKEILDKIMEEVLTAENCPYEAQVNMLVTDDEGIRKYNRQYRNIDASTDVLSFPMIFFETEADFGAAEKQPADCFEPESGELILGDIIISAQKVKEQARKFEHSEKREMAFLITHSLLHLCGYDHITEKEAEIMEKKQEEILERLGITRSMP